MTMSPTYKKTKKLASGVMAAVLIASTGLSDAGYAQNEMPTVQETEEPEVSMAEPVEEVITPESENDQTQFETEWESSENETTSEAETILESSTNEIVSQDLNKETIEETTKEIEESETVEWETIQEKQPETGLEERTTEYSPEQFLELCEDSLLSLTELDEIDFSSKRLLVAADETTIIDPQDILSSYNGVYLMQYETVQQAKYAYAYYYGKSTFVDVDTIVVAADGDTGANAASPMDVFENPIVELQEALIQNPVNLSGTVAIIDTGVSGVAGVIEAVSMIGENVFDENGHGTKMAQLVEQQNPSAPIVSIKALGADGTGDLSAVYAAIRYAIEQRVSVINLSLSAVGTAENAALNSIIDEAVQSGIAVVGAAGNNGRDARFYVPGNIKSAWIIGAADENGQRRASSNYGDTVDFNVIADSTSEAAALFSGYYTLYGAQADEKLVFPTDYQKKEPDKSFNGPLIRHQVSYYDYQKSREDLVWVSTKQMKTKVDENGTILTYIGFAEDAPSIQDIGIYVDFMHISTEKNITEECQIDLANMTVAIPKSYSDCDLTVRWYMSNATYGYCYDVDAKYMISNTPEKFRGAYNAIDGLNLEVAQQYVEGTYSKDFTHASDSINHSYVNYSTDEINIGDSFSITAGYTASLEDNNTNYTSRAQAKEIFGARAFANKAGELEAQTFLNHFEKVVRSSDGADVSSWFQNIGGTGSGSLLIDADNDGQTETQASAGLGWVFGTCAMNELEGQCPAFSGGKIICTGKDPDGTAYFFYYCTSPRAQYNGGSFSITPILPKTGFLQIQKNSSDLTLSKGNNCYSFEGIQYTAYSDKNCTRAVTAVTLNKDGMSNIVELKEGTYYIKESQNPDSSGFALSDQIYTVTVTTESTAETPVVVSVQDAPLNDPFGIAIYKEDNDGNTAFDLSGAEYTIRYYAGQYNINNLPASPTTTWVIKTKKTAAGYVAYLNDSCIVSGSATYGKSDNGMYRIPLGTVTVQETKAPEGFMIEGAIVSSMKNGSVLTGKNGVYLFNLVSEGASVSLKCGNALSEKLTGEASAAIRYKELQKKGGIRVEKYDADNKTASGNASLSGIKFAVINDTGAAITNKNGQTIANGDVVQIIVTDESGNASTGLRDLPLGDYIVKELRMDSEFDGKKLTEGSSPLANDSYFWKENQAQVTISESDIGKLVQTKAFYNEVVTAVPKIEKWDLELNKKAPMEGMSFEKITFEIYNASKNAVLIDKKRYQPGEMIVKVVSDAVGNVQLTTRFPVGHYRVKEATANEQYTVATNEVHYFDVVSKNGAGVVSYEAGNAVCFKNRVVRGDLTFSKINGETNEALAYIPFRVTNNVTKETHYILTDAKGRFSSASGKTVHTNANDTILSQYQANDTIPQKVMDSLAKDAGVWFGMGSEGSTTSAKEQYGAFVYGTYTITELRTESTKDMNMYSGTFTINADAKTIDLGTVRNIPMVLQTTLEGPNGSHCVYADSVVTLTDHVSYRNLEVGKKYTLTGTLYGKDGDQLTELVTQKIEFQPEKSDGMQDVVFKIDASSIAGKSVVAFEELTLDGRFCAEHKDKNDENQTVYFPKIQTHAEDSLTKSNHMESDQKAVIVDTVSYSGLLPGKEYTISGILMNKDNGKPITDKAGNSITSETIFKAENTAGSVQVVFEFDASLLAGTAIVVFESCFYNDIEVATHADLTDENQTVYIPQIKTMACGVDTKEHITKANEIITIVDTVSYSGLKAGCEYTIKGILMDQVTGEALEVDGKTVVAETSFVPEHTHGTVEVPFTFAGKELEGCVLTVFETLYLEERTLAVHADIHDESQTIFIPSIRTKASDAVTQISYTQPTKNARIIDTVSYSNLVPGKEYTMTGTLMDKRTGEPVLIEGQPLQANTVFVAENTQGNVQVVFEFDASLLGGTTVVAFESCFYNGIEVAVHADITDEDQTIYIPKLGTTAVDKESKAHEGTLSKTSVIEDEVFYENLILGKEYTVNGTLMVKETGEMLMQDGVPVTATKTFTAETADGSIILEFTFDSNLVAGKHVVAFEELIYETITIAAHTDIEDEDQTVFYPAPLPSEPEPDQEQKKIEPPVVTGDTSSPIWYVLGLFVSACAVLAITVLLKKQKNERYNK